MKLLNIFSDKQIIDNLDTVGTYYTCQILSGKWQYCIIFYLSQSEQLSYSELKRKIGKVSDAVLSQKLKFLEDVQIIKKTIYPTVPPRTEYRLTEQGKKLSQIGKTMNEFGLISSSRISKLRQKKEEI